MNDTNQMGSLLSKMTADTAGETKFSPDQADSIIEVLLPRIVTGLPGMPKGFTTSMERDADGWTLRINRPK